MATYDRKLVHSKAEVSNPKRDGQSNGPATPDDGNHQRPDPTKNFGLSGATTA